MKKSFEIILVILFLYTDILRQRTQDVEVKRYCVSLLEKLGSFKYTAEVLEMLDTEARAEVRTEPHSPIHFRYVC